MKSINRILLTSLMVGLYACASKPTGPGVLVLPGTNKNINQFRADDINCRQFVNGQLGGDTSSKSGNPSAAGTAAVNTDSAYYGTQQHYDWAYIQCMYSQGHRVPVTGQFSNEVARTNVATPSANIPPPPAGNPPPPPTH